MASKRYTLEQLFPENKPRYATVQRALEREDRSQAEQKELDSGSAILVVVPSLGEIPANVCVAAGNVARITFQKSEEVLSSLVGWFTRQWGATAPLATEPRWLGATTGLRVDVYLKKADGVFIDAMPYTPYVGQLTRLFDAARGEPSGLPWPGMGKRELLELPGFKMQGELAVCAVGFTEDSPMVTSWYAELEGDKVKTVNFDLVFAKSKANALTLAKPLLEGWSVTKSANDLELTTKDGVRVSVQKKGRASARKA